jgi:hypothetical protein
MSSVITLLAVMVGLAAVVLAADHGLFGESAKNLARRMRDWWSQ